MSRPHLLGLYAAYRCFLLVPDNEEANELPPPYVIHAAKVRNMIPENGSGGDEGSAADNDNDKKVIIYFELEQQQQQNGTTQQQQCEPSWERHQLLLDTAAAMDEEDGVAVANEL